MFTPEQIRPLLEALSHSDAVIVGGQAINLMNSRSETPDPKQIGRKELKDLRERSAPLSLRSMPSLNIAQFWRDSSEQEETEKTEEQELSVTSVSSCSTAAFGSGFAALRFLAARIPCLLFVCFVVCFGVNSSAAVFTSNTTISETNAAYDGQDIVISGVPLSNSAFSPQPSAFPSASLFLTNGAVLAHSPCSATHKLDLTVTHEVVGACRPSP